MLGIDLLSGLDFFCWLPGGAESHWLPHTNLSSEPNSREPEALPHQQHTPHALRNIGYTRSCLNVSTIRTRLPHCGHSDIMGTYSIHTTNYHPLSPHQLTSECNIDLPHPQGPKVDVPWPAAGSTQLFVAALYCHAGYKYTRRITATPTTPYSCIPCKVYEELKCPHCCRGDKRAESAMQNTTPACRVSVAAATTCMLC
jgi:hypothetical protein